MAEDKPTIDERVEARVIDELSPIDMEARFNDMLDDCYSFDAVGGPFSHMQPSRVLLECDPVAHRCGVNDYADSISRDSDIEEINGDYYDASEVQTIRDEEEAEDEADSEDEDDEDEDEETGVRHTSCRLCGQDIEGLAPFTIGEWRDRGNNTHCPTADGDAGQLHEPTEAATP